MIFRKGSLVEFHPPPGVISPELQPNEEFDARTKFRLKEGGTVCIVEIGDVRMPGYENKPEQKSGGAYRSRPSYPMPGDEQGGYS